MGNRKARPDDPVGRGMWHAKEMEGKIPIEYSVKAKNRNQLLIR